MGAPAEQVVVANNSSLALMHDTVVFALLKGTCDSVTPWSKQGEIAFLCPVPGYDRHFTICQSYGIRMIPVALHEDGPDMDEVERLVAQDASIKGMWCVPKYSNPTGTIYSDAVVERLAAMKTAAPDFRLYWDNAYGVHHLTRRAHRDRKHPGVVRASRKSEPSVPVSFHLQDHAGRRRTGHVCRLQRQREVASRKTHDADHRSRQDQPVAPCSLPEERGRNSAVDGPAQSSDRAQIPEGARYLRREAGPCSRRHLDQPKGGYFISLDVPKGCAQRVVALAKEAGVALTPAGSTHPYGKDPDDRTIRIAPTFPELAEVAQAAEGVALCVLLAAAESRD